MSWVEIISLLMVGFLAGYLSALVGIGGGVIIVPALVLIFGFGQHRAQGTTLALLVPPVGALAAFEYYKKGFVDLRAAALICLGFVVGGFLGGRIAVNIPEELLRKIFAFTLLFLGARMLLTKSA